MSKLLVWVWEDKLRFSTKTGQPTKISTELCEKIDQAYQPTTKLIIS
jgi:hypothetical protein